MIQTVVRNKTCCFIIINIIIIVVVVIVIIMMLTVKSRGPEGGPERGVHILSTPT